MDLWEKAKKASFAGGAILCSSEVQRSEDICVYDGSLISDIRGTMADGAYQLTKLDMSPGELEVGQTTR